MTQEKNRILVSSFLEHRLRQKNKHGSLSSRSLSSWLHFCASFRHAQCKHIVPTSHCFAVPCCFYSLELSKSSIPRFPGTSRSCSCVRGEWGYPDFCPEILFLMPHATDHSPPLILLWESLSMWQLGIELT